WSIGCQRSNFTAEYYLDFAFCSRAYRFSAIGAQVQIRAKRKEKPGFGGFIFGCPADLALARRLAANTYQPELCVFFGEALRQPRRYKCALERNVLAVAQRLRIRKSVPIFASRRSRSAFGRAAPKIAPYSPVGSAR